MDYSNRSCDMVRVPAMESPVVAIKLTVSYSLTTLTSLITVSSDIFVSVSKLLCSAFAVDHHANNHDLVSAVFYNHKKWVSVLRGGANDKLGLFKLSYSSVHQCIHSDVSFFDQHTLSSFCPILTLSLP